MSILITICARGGSKGIPGKNIKRLNEKPLIYYTIRVSKQFQSKYKDVEIVLSTDSEEIVQVAKEFNLNSDYRRPDSLASDTSGKIDAIKDVLLWTERKNKSKFDYILDLDVTSPLRNLNDLIVAYNTIKNNKNAINLFSVSASNRSPYFNMVEEKKDGFFSVIKTPEKLTLTRQSAPTVFDMNASFYFYKRAFFDLGYFSAITDKSIIYEVPHICFDIDHPIDFDIITYLMETNKLDFTL
jgi:CMP-N,N'-diacetyllegionaminic acid synthase